MLPPQRDHKLTADKASNVASLQQLSRRMMGFASSLKMQCIRVSLNLISTPSTLSCKQKQNQWLMQKQIQVRVTKSNNKNFSVLHRRIVLLVQWVKSGADKYFIIVWAKQFLALNYEEIQRRLNSPKNAREETNRLAWLATKTR